ncbi:MAG: hypothetical protein P1U67_11425 [Alcanivoracaceae bacterium]|nr:hypothetical protein [Alcanivoracaceae bacterium]
MAISGYHSHFVDIGTHRLFVAEHSPECPRGAVLLCSPFLEEKLFCRRILKNLAESLSEQGWLVIRFDGYGEGDSEGELSNADLVTSASDCASLIHLLRERVDGPIVVVGMRWGANIALFSNIENVDAVMAVDPLSSGEEYVQQLLRQNLTTQMATWGGVRENREALLAASEQGRCINIQGFDLGPKLISQMRKVVLPSSVSAKKVSIIRTGLKDSELPPFWQEHVDKLGATYRLAEGRPYWFEPKIYDPTQFALTSVVSEQFIEWFA